MNDANEVKIYRYNDDISFRQCSLANKVNNCTNGDCTCFYESEENWKTYYHCNQYGIHLHCSKHPEIEFELSNEFSTSYLKCPKCNKTVRVDNFNKLLQNCLKILNIPKFKNAKLIRLDDWYIPELKERIEIKSDYWIKTDVKTDRDNDTIIILYVGKKSFTLPLKFPVQRLHSPRTLGRNKNGAVLFT